MILREWWTGIDTVSISEMTGDDSFPQAASGTNYETIFEAPTNWADDYGTRMRGFLHPTITGDYTFWIASDDNGELWLSNDSNPGNVSLIATVPGWSSSRDWDKYSEQDGPSVVWAVLAEPQARRANRSSAVIRVKDGFFMPFLSSHKKEGP